MSYNATVINVMLATPSDVATERQIIRDVLAEWNSTHSHDRKIVLLPIGWDTHASPQMGERAQAIINKQVLQHADLLVAVFWARLGSPTGAAPSGTVEEIEEHLRAGKPAMLYFSSAPVRPDSVNEEQYRALKEFKSQVESRGLIESYESIAEFRQKLSRQVTQTTSRVWASVAGVLIPDGTESAQSASPRLSDDAKTLLLEAAADHQGTVLVIETFGGVQISTNGKELVEEQTPRAEARWKGAVSELLSGGFLIDRGHKGEVLSVTQRLRTFFEAAGSCHHCSRRRLVPS
jgi:hypothetical protein